MPTSQQYFKTNIATRTRTHTYIPRKWILYNTKKKPDIFFNHV